MGIVISRCRILVVSLWVGWSVGVGVSVTAQPPAGVREAHPTVRRLLEGEGPDEAFAEILSWPKNLFKAASYSPRDQEVVDVLVCPQRDEPPLYAVLTNPMSLDQRITLLDGDGTIVPFYPDRKWIHHQLDDVNGDGLVELVGERPIRLRIDGEVVYMEALFVLPVTRENRAVLTVLYNAQQPPESSSPRWSWRLSETTTPGVLAIELGPQVSRDEPMDVQVTYTWSAERQRFVGPLGDYAMPFLLVEGEESEEVELFARKAYERDPRNLRTSSEGLFHVSGDVRPPRKIMAPQPHYTVKARKKRIQGVVIVQTVIDKEGNVTDVKVLKGLPHGLTETAVEAISRWKFEPATFNGEPVNVYYNLTVNFRLE